MLHCREWRIISYAVNDALSNMAIDEAILEAHLAGFVPPTLRLYGFKPAAVSIGRNQTVPSVLNNKATERGIAVVRRPTGGRAVLHQGDITYSFVGSNKKVNQQELTFENEQNNSSNWVTSCVSDAGFLADNVREAYKQICQGIIRAFSKLGLELQLGSSQSSYKQLYDCFLATTSSDLHINGRKIVGSAQLRRKGCVLQHGSILLNQDQLAMAYLLEEENPGSREKIHHANLFDLIGRALSFVELESLIKAGFEEAFEVRLNVAELTRYERQIANRLATQYVP